MYICLHACMQACKILPEVSQMKWWLLAIATKPHIFTCLLITIVNYLCQWLQRGKNGNVVLVQ